MKVVQIPRDSPHFPLPRDYKSLTEKGQRQARVNACRLWLTDPAGDYWGPDLLPTCVEFFDRAYLRHEDGMFYPPGLMRPNPRFHSDILRFIASNKTSLIAAPRDSAKSTLIRKTVALMLLAGHLYFITYVSSTNKNTKRFMSDTMRLFRQNAWLNDDWGPEMGGRIIPNRGYLPFGSEEMNLMNGCRLMQSSIESRNRGDRPAFLVVDDPEYDGKGASNKTIMREDVERHILQEMVPMVMNSGARLAWIGTTISRRHLLTAVMESNDPAHRMWGRMRLRALYRRDGEPVTTLTGVEPSDLVSLWPERYSVKDYLDIATRLRSHFWAEYMSDPRVSHGEVVTLDDRHGYKIHQPDEHTTTEPWRSSALIEWEDGDGLSRSLPLKNFCAQMTVMQTVDWAMSDTATSDYSAIATIAHTPDNQLFVLDIWAGRVTGDKLAQKCIEEARKWRPDMVGVEAPNIRHHMMHLIKTKFTEAAKAGAWFPHVRPITDPWRKHERKADRISGLLWRFGSEEGPVHIKLPFQREREFGIRMLFEQIREFKPGVEGGDLMHDDVLDAVSMSQSIIAGNPRWKKPTEDAESPLQCLMDGKMVDDLGRPYAALMGGLENIPSEIVEKVIDAARRQPQTRRRSKA